MYEAFLAAGIVCIFVVGIAYLIDKRTSERSDRPAGSGGGAGSDGNQSHEK